MLQYQCFFTELERTYDDEYVVLRRREPVRAHIDFAVSNLEKSASYAVPCGARVSPQQFSESWTVLFDPEGHPFCLCLLKRIFENPQFGLL